VNCISCDDMKQFLDTKSEGVMKMRDVLVTIVCITYNHEKYLRDALDGFLSQKTDFQYKIVIHDDASTDSTAAIIECELP